MASFITSTGLQPLRFAFSQSVHYAPFPTCLRSSSTPGLVRRHLSSKRSPSSSVKPTNSSARSTLRLQEFERSPTPSSHTKKGPFAQFERLLANAKGNRLELFRAPSHRSFKLGASVTATMFFTFAGYHGYFHCLNPPTDLPLWIRSLFGGIGLVSAWLGTMFLLRGRNLINNISAVRVSNQTQLHVSVRSLMPFVKPGEIVASPTQVSLSQQLVGPELESDASWNKLRTQLEAHRRAETTSFWKAPIQKMSFVLWRIFTNARRVFTNEFFATMKVRGGEKLKLDLTGGVSPAFEALSADIVETE